MNEELSNKSKYNIQNIYSIKNTLQQYIKYKVALVAFISSLPLVTIYAINHRNFIC